eukprot:jgi/Undpi1/8230/HiC_scaffold_25.g10700.m1
MGSGRSGAVSGNGVGKSLWTGLPMSCPSAILNRLRPAEKKSLAGLVAVSLPADDLADGQWSVTLLEDILVFLDLDRELAEGFHPITERARRGLTPPQDVKASWEQRVGAFRTCLPPVGEPRLVVLRDLMVVVALRCGYDARTRVTFRRVCDAMQVPWHPRVSEVESTLARKVYERVTRERERELRGDRWRSVKIGAAMIGGGTLLAVTGGLAAPAFAAGLAATSSVIGASAAATLSGFATTAWMATVFGATGAGLVGYKMDRRTQGVKEFEFESQTSVGEEMCVSICVPGVLKDKADLQRGWGVEPRGEDVSARERLRRFYYVYNRDKVEDVDDILDAYDGQESKLCRALYARYKADPRDPPTREALANAEGRAVEGVSKEDIKRDAEAIGQLMEAVLSKEKQEKEQARVESPSSSDVDLEEPVTAAALTELVWGNPPPAAAAPPSLSSSSSATAPAVASATVATVPAETAPETAATAPATVAPAARAGPAGAGAGAGAGAAASTATKSNETIPLVRGFPVAAPSPAATATTATTSNDNHGGGKSNASGDGVLLRDWDRSDDGSGDANREVIEMVEEEGDVAAEGEGKKDKDAFKHRVWFWQDALPHTDQYILRWESDWLITLGKSVESMIKSLSQSAMQETLKYTTLAAIMTSLTWPLALLALSSMIDADWTIGRERADVAGKILADALLNREQGCRPVTLVGTSLGARLIFACLEEIARRHELWEEQTSESDAAGKKQSGSAATGRSKMTRLKNVVTPDNRGKSRVGLNGVGVPASSGGGSGGGAGIIENVCLLGAPLGASSARWERVARMVHGRIINGYSKSDIILGLVFRAKSLSLSVAGIQKVSAVGVENVDLSSVVGSNHFNYNRRMPEILSLLALDDCSKYIARGDPPQLNSSRRFSAASTATASSRSLENGTAPSTPTSTSTFAGRDGSDTLFP